MSTTDARSRGRVLVTGAAGYIGSGLVRRLLARDWQVLGLDCLRFGGESLLPLFADHRFELVRGDVRDSELVEHLLDRADAVVHLASLVGDPACAREPELCEAINWTATRDLYDRACAKPGVARFVYASTCSNYGRMEAGETVHEGSPLRPVSLYARTKVRVEEHILDHTGPEGFAPVVLRFATAFGISPRMRFDLTVNHFTRDAHQHGELDVYGVEFWRPYCHVVDIARACTTMLEAPASRVAGQVFGVGDSRENYQKGAIAQLVRDRLPSTTIRTVPQPDDPRDYRVDFTKIRERFDFEASRTVADGVREIATLLDSGIVDDPFADRFRNV